MTDRRAMKRGRRDGDGESGWRALIRENWYRDVWLFLVTALVVWSLYTFEHEAAMRRDQTCTLFERADVKAKSQLARTYEYLANLTPEDYRDDPTGINKAVLVGLPVVEAEAETSGAPAYCAPKDVGLPVPPPKMPKRPSGIPTPSPPP